MDNGFMLTSIRLSVEVQHLFGLLLVNRSNQVLDSIYA